MCHAWSCSAHSVSALRFLFFEAIANAMPSAYHLIQLEVSKSLFGPCPQLCHNSWPPSSSWYMKHISSRTSHDIHKTYKFSIIAANFKQDEIYIKRNLFNWTSPGMLNNYSRILADVQMHSEFFFLFYSLLHFFNYNQISSSSLDPRITEV